MLLKSLVKTCEVSVRNDECQLMQETWKSFVKLVIQIYDLQFMISVFHKGLCSIEYGKWL